MVKFKKRIKMKDKNHHHHAIWRKRLRDYALTFIV